MYANFCMHKSESISIHLSISHHALVHYLYKPCETFRSYCVQSSRKYKLLFFKAYLLKREVKYEESQVLPSVGFILKQMFRGMISIYPSEMR